MRLRSRGLGKKELVMDFREYAIVEEGDELVVVGTIRDPVNWDFTIRVCEDDLAGLVKLTLHPKTLGLVLRALFKSRKKNHWGQEHAEHIAEGQKRLVAAIESAPEKAKAAMQPVAAPKRRAARTAGSSRVSTTEKTSSAMAAQGASTE